MTLQETGVIAILGILAVAVGWAKTVWSWLQGIVVVSTGLELAMADALVSYLEVKARRVGKPSTYGAVFFYVEKRGRSELIPHVRLRLASSKYRVRGIPVWFTSNIKSEDVNQGIVSRIYTIRGTLRVEDLLRSACTWINEDMAGRTRRHTVTYHHGGGIRSLDGSKPTENGGTDMSWFHYGHGVRLIDRTPGDLMQTSYADPRRALDDMIMTPEVEMLTRDIREWIEDREWHAARGIPWRLSCLCEGPPGNGKTSHARATATSLDLPVHVFDLATMSNEDLRRAWATMSATAPCMALIEDIDRVFHGDTNVSPPSGMLSSGGLTFNALLNAIDGIERHDGILLVVTANDASRIDPALRRRMDRTVTFSPLDSVRKATLARRVIDDPALAEQIAIEHASASTSAFTTMCCQAAKAARRKKAPGADRV